jgi:hypothetical protein
MDNQKPNRNCALSHRLVSDLSSHEREELKMDYDLPVSDGYILAVLTRAEWYSVKRGRGKP